LILSYCLLCCLSLSDTRQAPSSTFFPYTTLFRSGEAEDAVERGAQLMAHVRQELRLDAAGLLGGLASQIQLDVLDLDGFQGLAQVLGGLIDVLLQLALGALHGLGHVVDALGQVLELPAALIGQAYIEV